MNLTAGQQTAITARGNVLVVAGAGTGKTHTLVERCLSCLLDKEAPASLDEILMVTFTEAAAAEMRQRIRERIEQELRKESDPNLATPHEHRQKPDLHEQLALFDTAHLGTLHGFCLQLVRQHFYQFDLDPQLSVLAQEEASLLADETLELMLQGHYGGNASAAQAVQQLIQNQGRGWDKPIRALVLRLHHYTQTRPDPARWFEEQLGRFAGGQPDDWQRWLLAGLADWRKRWLPLLERQTTENELAQACSAALRSLSAQPSRVEAAAALATVSAAGQACPLGKKNDWRKPLESFLEETDFLLSLAAMTGNVDPLAEDWDWVRPQMMTLLELAREFEAAFTQAKRELGVVDFHDLEQYALRLLWDTPASQPTRIALAWRKKLRFIFVDEYQDINTAQDKIIQALSRDGAQANRFLVGDVKQSIYRFRLADPYIFKSYEQSWRNGDGCVVPLVENFRSREGLLAFINSLFGLVMQDKVAGISYDQQAQLRFGAAEQRRELSLAASSAPCVELHLQINGASQQEGDDETAEALAEVSDLKDAEKEARLVGLRLAELKASQHPIWDEKAKTFRPVQWSDMVVLLRSPANKAESYAKEFSRLNVPLRVARGGFYQSTEISDLLSVLQLLDNPLQDLPALAVLHSPLVGLTLDELSSIRLTVKGRFWTALVRWHESQSPSASVAAWKRSSVRASGPTLQRSDAPTLPRPGARNLQPGDPLTKLHPAAPGAQHGQPPVTGPETFRKVTTFLQRFAHWRRLARQISLSRCLEAVLSETHYDAWLLTQPSGEQRHANIQRLLGLAQQFDQFQRQSLFRFLRFIEAQQRADAEPEVAAVGEEDAVGLMSIHRSKGLEFPVVVVADLGKSFNVSDLRAELIFDEQYGLCPQIKPPHTGRSYPSLPYWLARQRQQRELLGEELRLLYVAMTRARDTLVLSGRVSKTKFDKLWKPNGEVDTEALTSARSYSDWLGCWFSQHSGSGQAAAAAGANSFLRWVIHDDTKLLEPSAMTASAEPAAESARTAAPEVWSKLLQRLAWSYPFVAATRKPAKTSVTLLRRRAAGRVDEEAASLFEVQTRRSESHDQRSERAYQTDVTQKAGEGKSRAARPRAKPLAAADIGSAHHAFLQFVSLECSATLEALKTEAHRLEGQGLLSPEQIALLDFEALAGFWQSALGQKVRAQAHCVQRELVFTARFAVQELAALTREPPEPSLDDEFIVVQGVADLVVLLPQELWLIDFKTDYLDANELPARVKVYEPQLKLYARALSQICQRPVSERWLYFLALQTAVPISD